MDDQLNSPLFQGQPSLCGGRAQTGDSGHKANDVGTVVIAGLPQSE